MMMTDPAPRSVSTLAGDKPPPMAGGIYTSARN